VERKLKVGCEGRRPKESSHPLNTATASLGRLKRQRHPSRAYHTGATAWLAWRQRFNRLVARGVELRPSAKEIGGVRGEMGFSLAPRNAAAVIGDQTAAASTPIKAMLCVKGLIAWPPRVGVGCITRRLSLTGMILGSGVWCRLARGQEGRQS
jgi:hypothetical protein